MTIASFLRRLFPGADSEGFDPSDLAIPIDVDLALDMLSIERRRWILREVAARDDGRGVELGTLSTDRAAVEQDTHPDLVSSDARKRVYVAFYQTHVPKLVTAGLLDEGNNRLFATEATEDVTVALDVIGQMLDPPASDPTPPSPDDLVPDDAEPGDEQPLVTDGGSTTLADLEALVDDHERIDWTAVPGIGVAEAATWSARLQEAADELDEQPLVTDGGRSSRVDYDHVGFVTSSDYRVDTLSVLAGRPATPKGIAEDSNISIAHVSRALGELRDEGLVELLVSEERRKGRIYGLTDEGERVIEAVTSITHERVALSIDVHSERAVDIIEDGRSAVESDLGKPVTLARAIEEMAKAYVATDGEEVVADGGQEIEQPATIDIESIDSFNHGNTIGILTAGDDEAFQGHTLFSTELIREAMEMFEDEFGPQSGAEVALVKEDEANPFLALIPTDSSDRAVILAPQIPPGGSTQAEEFVVDGGGGGSA